MKKLGKQVKSSGKRGDGVGDRPIRKKKTHVTTHKKSDRKMESTSSSELSVENGKGGDMVAENEQLDGDEISVHIPFRFQFKPNEFEDSRDAATDLFRLVINPVSTEQFFE